MGSAPGGELGVNDLWFSLGVEADLLAGPKTAKPLTGGWRACRGFNKEVERRCAW